jgi:spermidine synthase
MTDPSSRPMSFGAAAACAALAGAATLAIELVWLRILSLTFGSASVAAGAVVAALMLGMAIGSAWAARKPSLSLGVALLVQAAAAAVSAPVVHMLGSLGPASVALVSVFLIAAAVPMGMAVPLLVGRFKAADARLAGQLYACNTLGSALSVLATGFLLLPALGNQKTLWCAAALLAPLGALLLRRRDAAVPEAPAPPPPLPGAATRILLVYGVSAFAAMASEIGWMRALVLSVGSSTYANTIVLGVYIAGLGLGSALALRGRSARAFGSIQLLLALVCFGTLHLLGHLPAFFGRIFQDRVASLGSFSLAALAAAAVALLPPTILIGASFTVAVRWLGAHAVPSRASGLLLAVATAASTAGALVASFIAIPLTGVQGTLILPIFLHAVAGSAALSYLGERRRIWPSFAAAALLALLYFRPPWDVLTVQSGPYIYGDEKAGKEDPRKVLFAKDDRVASVAVFELPDGNRVLRIDGKTDASLSQIDLVTQLLTAHLPLSVHPKPERIALVGLGSGMTLASCLKYDPKQVDCIEISPAVVRASHYFDGETGGPLADPRVKLHVADARSVIRSLDGKFDVILNEPSNLWIAGMAGLFTEEFYHTCADHLAERGLMGQWLHAYGVTGETFRDAVATFQKVFPYITVWEMWVSGDYLFIGSQKPYEIDAATMDGWLGRQAIADDLRRIDVSGSGGLLGDLVATSKDFDGHTDARIQTDDGLHLEFLAPLGFYGRKRMPPFSYLPPVSAANLGAVVKGRAIEWAEARDFLRRGIRAVLEEKPMAERIDPFRKALQKYPEDRQARLMLEDQVDQCLKKSDWDAVPPESRQYVEARMRKIAGLKTKGALPGVLIEEYKRALEVAPDHETVLAGLSEALLAAGAIADADEVSARAVGKRPDSARARLIRGKVYAAQKKSQEARGEWIAARKLAPDSPYGKEADKLLKGE